MLSRPKTILNLSRTSLIILGLSMVALVFMMVGRPLRASAACTTPDTSRGYVTSTFNIPADGTYRVWSRILAPDNTNNSYIMQIDNTTCGVVVGDSSSIPANTWTWVDYQSGTPSNTINVTLTSGQHTMTMYGREDNVELDRVILTADMSCVPTAGTDGSNCLPQAAPPDTTPPTVSITSPTNGQSVSGKTFAIQANAADNVAVAKVEFYIDNTLLNTDTSSPYTYTIDTTGYSNGNHTVYAIAYDTSGNKQQSNSVTMNVNNAAVCKSSSSVPVSTPTGLTKSSSSYTSITLGWNASTPSPGCTISGYHLYRDGTQVGGNITSGTSYSDTGLMAGSSHTYTLEAYDSGANVSARSAAGVFTTVADNVAPTIPTGFASSANTASSVTLNWSASTDLPNPGGSGLKAYYIYRNGATGTPTYTVNAPATSYVDTNVSASTSYTYTISAVDNNGNESAGSSIITVKTAAPACSGSPSVPAGLASTGVTISTIGFSWTASSPSTGCTLSGYHIYRQGTYIGDSTSTGFQDKGLTPNTAYTYTVAAFGSNGASSAQSASKTIATAADTTPPTTPTNVVDNAAGSSLVTLSWSPSSDNVGVAGYRVYRNGNFLASVGPTVTSYNDTSVSPNTEYSYQVSAIDTAGNESPKATPVPASVQTPQASDTTPPTPPQSPSVPVVTSQSASLTWTPSTDNTAVAGYRVYINGVLSNTTAPSVTSVAESCLAPNVPYTFTIKAFDAAGNMSTAASVSKTTTSGALTGDVDCNGVVNSLDLFTMLRNWQFTSALPINGDVNGDVKVNSTDLFGLLRNWNKKS